MGLRSMRGRLPDGGRQAAWRLVPVYNQWQIASRQTIPSDKASASSTKTLARTAIGAPSARSSGVALSFSLWLISLARSTKIIPSGGGVNPILGQWPRRVALIAHLAGGIQTWAASRSVAAGWAFGRRAYRSCELPSSASPYGRARAWDAARRSISPTIEYQLPIVSTGEPPLPVIIDRAGRNFNADETDGVSGRDTLVRCRERLGGLLRYYHRAA
jgi:hypothetical protein